MLNKIVRFFSGKKKYQPWFERVNQLALYGMNIGGPDDPESSGEKYALHYIKSKLDNLDDLILFDVGANVGSYTIMLNELWEDKVQIFSFEPSMKTYEKFILNTKNCLNVRPFNIGFSNNADKMGTIYTNAQESGLASLYKRRLDHFDIAMDITEEIELDTIDNFCSLNGIDHIHFLKLDVEGHELKVLEGAKKLLASNKIDFIQFEFGGCNIDSRTYFQDFYYLLKSNFKIYRIVRDGLYPLQGYNEMYEAFIMTNFLAERII